MKYIILTKKNLTNAFLIIIAVILLVILGTHLVSKAVESSAANRKLPVYSVETGKNQVALSFDAAWGNEDTQKLIDIMKNYGIKATFFVVGQWVDKFPDSVKALHDAGHSIQSHSDTHPHMPRLSVEAMTKEIAAANDKIEGVTGIRPTLLRPPYGDYNNTLIEVLAEQGMTCIQWDVDSLDWKDRSAKQIQDVVLGKVRPGSIVLFHNAAANTPAALPGIIEALKAEEYEFVLIKDMLLTGNYRIDHEGRQVPLVVPNDSSAITSKAVGSKAASSVSAAPSRSSSKAASSKAASKASSKAS